MKEERKNVKIDKVSKQYVHLMRSGPQLRLSFRGAALNNAGSVRTYNHTDQYKNLLVLQTKCFIKYANSDKISSNLHSTFLPLYVRMPLYTFLPFFERHQEEE